VVLPCVCLSFVATVRCAERGWCALGWILFFFVFGHISFGLDLVRLFFVFGHILLQRLMLLFGIFALCCAETTVSLVQGSVLVLDTLDKHNHVVVSLLAHPSPAAAVQVHDAHNVVARKSTSTPFPLL